MQDIKVFTIDINASKDEFEAFMKARVNNIRRVATLFVEGSPVTPPNIKGFITYHAVKLTDKEGHHPSAVLLFQEFNLYFIAFQPETGIETEDPDKLHARGWFAFKDAVMPSFLEYKTINYTVSYNKSS
jgi:hypothetical protein